MRTTLRPALLSLCLGFSVAQFLSPPTDLIHTTGYMNLPVRYKEVPEGICETTPGVKSYSGYVDIAPELHLFFWFFEARNQDPTTAPLTVWIDGGPGTPSMSTLFAEQGPCGVDSEGKLYYNPYSWNNVSNMLYIDQPANTGFSYTNVVPGYISSSGNFIQLPSPNCPDWLGPNLASTCGTYSTQNDSMTANSTMSAASAYWKAIQGFTGAFPQYSSNGFHFTTESYGGHYGPVFNAYTLQQNALIANGSLASTGAHHIDLRSVMIGNGWYDPVIQYGADYNFTVDPGTTYDLRPLSKNREQQMYNAMWGPGNCRDMLLDCARTGEVDTCVDADEFCADEVEKFLDVHGRDEYDVRELSSDPFPYDFYPDYLNREHVLKAIGAFINYTDNSVVVSDAFEDSGDDGRIDGTVDDVRQLWEQGVYVVEYAGDADYICNWLGGEVIANMTGPSDFNSAGYTNISTPDDIVHGEVKQRSNFAFARIFESGHSVPFYQPLVTLEMLKRVINGKDVATGLHDVRLGDSYKTEGPARSLFREGNETVVHHDLSPDATYNITTNKPNPPGIPPSSGRKRSLKKAKRGRGRLRK